MRGRKCGKITVLASDILAAIFVNLKRHCEKRQLFMKVDYNKFQRIFYELMLRDPESRQCLRNYFVFSDSGPAPFSPLLQKAIAELQLGGIICWPNTQEPDVMRLNPSAEDWYDKVLVANTKRKLALQDVITIQKIARRIDTNWPELIVDRPHLMNC